MTGGRRERAGGRSGVGRALLAAVRFYQRAISPALPPRCRFYPTCSAYAVEAIERHGAARGSWLALRRLVKCAPWHPGGVDPVPDPAPGRSPRVPPSGTGDAGRSSSTAVPADGPGTAAAPGDAGSSTPTTTPRARRRVTQEESSVA